MWTGVGRVGNGLRTSSVHPYYGEPMSKREFGKRKKKGESETSACNFLILLSSPLPLYDRFFEPRQLANALDLLRTSPPTLRFSPLYHTYIRNTGLWCRVRIPFPFDSFGQKRFRFAGGDSARTEGRSGEKLFRPVSFVHTRIASPYCNCMLARIYIFIYVYIIYFCVLLLGNKPVHLLRVR